MSRMESQGFVIVDRPGAGGTESEEGSQEENQSREQETQEKDPSTLERIQTWLSPTDFHGDGSEFRKHVQAHAPNTGGWLTASETYQKWLGSIEFGTLWIKGIPGSGKSVVAAHLTKGLSETQEAPVLFFFFKHTISMNSKPIYVVRDFLSQLTPHTTRLQSKLLMMIEKYQDIQDAPFQELWSVLLSELAIIPRVFVVVDALDEIEFGQDNFIGDVLMNIGALNPKSIKLAVTSRPLSKFEKMSENPHTLCQRLSGSPVDQDIETYIKYRLNEQNQRKLSDHEKLEIYQALCRKGRGLFLHARLMLDELLQSALPVQAQLERPLDSLSEIYQTLLHVHSARAGVDQEFQVFILQWVTHSSRPLRLIELAALALFRKAFTDAQIAKAVIRGCCGPLLEVLEDQTVQVVHHSFTEFLLDSKRASDLEQEKAIDGVPVLFQVDIHGILALACVEYLLSGVLTSYTMSDVNRWTPQKTKEDHLLHHHFLNYASQQWPYHVSRCHSSILVLFQNLDALLAEGSKELESWMLFWDQKMSNPPLGCQPLHIASYLGLTAYTKYLLEKGADVNAKDNAERTPVMFASEKGHSEVLITLLKHKADPCVYECLGLTAMHIAAINNHGHIVSILVGYGADPMVPKANDATVKFINHTAYSTPCLRKGSGWLTHTKSNSTVIGLTPIRLACELGCSEAVASLMQHMSSACREDIPLHWAATRGSSDVLSILLRFPEVVKQLDKQDDQGFTPLALVSSARNPEAVKVILEAGANVDPPLEDTGSSDEHRSKRGRINPIRGKTPLHYWAAINKDATLEEMEVVATLLIKAGCDVDARDLNGRTPLFSWKEQQCHDGLDAERYVRFVSILLRNGANAKATDLNGSTPLHEINGEKEEKEAIRLLIEAGANINAVRTSDGRCPLSAATHRRPSADIDIFLDYDADFNMQDYDGNTPLHYIMKDCLHGTVPVAKWLAACDPTITNHLGETCLFNVCLQFGYFSAQNYTLLLQHGVDIEQKNVLGRTAILEACINGSDESITALCRLGARVAESGHDGKTCLHLLVGKQPFRCARRKDVKKMKKIMQMLIQAGANIRATDRSGNSVFHDAAGHEEDHVISSDSRLVALKSVAELGGANNSKNHEGKTALHIAAANCWDKQMREENCDVARLDFLLQPKFAIDVSAKDHTGTTALHIAASVSVVMAWKLISAGADVQARTFDGRSPLHFAARASLSNSVGLLCDLYSQNSWSVDQKDTKGQTPLHEAARSGNMESVSFLLRSGANPTCTDHSKRTPLHAAACFRVVSSHMEAEREFYEERKLNSQSLLQRKLQFRSVRNPCLKKNPLEFEPTNDLDCRNIVDVVRVLLRAGADSNAVDVSDHTAYDVAIMNSCDSVAEILSHCTLNSESVETMSFLNNLARKWGSLNSDTLPSDEALKGQLLEAAVTLRNEALIEGLLKSGVKFDSSDHTAECSGTSMTKPAVHLTLIHSIVSSGCVSIMEIFILYIQDINSFSPPLLHVAADREASNIEMMRLLLQRGADPNAVYQPQRNSNARSRGDVPPIYKNHTVLHKVARGWCWWYPNALSLLLEHGADIEATESRPHGIEMTCLQIAVSEHLGFWKEQCLDMLLAKGANVNRLQSSTGLTPLNLALENGLGLRIFQKLLAHGADISLGSNPPLISAITGMDLEAARGMLEAGADPNGLYCLHDGEKTPLQVVADAWSKATLDSWDIDEFFSLIQLLLDHGADPYKKIRSMEHGNTTVFHYICFKNGPIKPIISSGVDLEVKDSHGRTPLHAASSFYGYVPQGGMDFVAEELIRSGADVNAKDDGGRTPLHYAVQSMTDLSSVVQALIRHGASPGLKDGQSGNGESPLYYTLRNADLEEYAVIWQTNELLDAGIDLKNENEPGEETSFHRVTERLAQSSESYTEWIPIYQRFIDAGCDCNVRDEKGNTPAFVFVAHFNINKSSYFSSKRQPLDVERCKEILANHDVLAVNDDGDNLLHVVAQREETLSGKQDGVVLFRLLMDLGVDPKKENKQGVSPLDVAAMCGKDEILEIFKQKD
ncbi:ankyrin [Lepidopterella palustris CBS 459.81]|uniref:Ankyrin n=1 Tax=Lepidopterella palustris CBS 459.81 TaxID=1314670 RepID=A0A8E2J951_9PEZI|nr:ankyrin [Lepidopterella palustris CBS 459.81]